MPGTTIKEATKMPKTFVTPMQVGVPLNQIFGSVYVGRDSANIPMPANLLEAWPDVDAYPLGELLGQLLADWCNAQIPPAEPATAPAAESTPQLTPEPSTDPTPEPTPTI
jgi:hypothetical protein